MPFRATPTLVQAASGRLTRPDVRCYDVQWERHVFRPPGLPSLPPGIEVPALSPRFNVRPARREPAAPVKFAA